MSYLTIFLFIVIPLWVAAQWSKRSLERTYEDCFRSRCYTDGSWCLRPIGHECCKRCPHYNIQN